MTTPTLKPSGGDFTTLTGWEATLTGALLAPAQIDFYNFGPGGLIETGGCAVSGFTATNTNRPIINVPAGQGYTGLAHSGAWYGTGQTSGAITVLRYGTDIDYASVIGLEIEGLDTGANAFHWNTSCTAILNEFVMKQCVLHAPYVPIGIFAPQGKFIFHNNIMYATTADRVIDIRNVTSVEFYNNTVYTAGGDFPFLGDGAVSAINNVVAGGSNKDMWNTFGLTGSYNATGDATATTLSPGTGGVNNITPSAVFTSVGAGIQNFHLQAGANVLYNAGTTLAGVTIDIFGTARPQVGIYDIGACERAAAAAANNNSMGLTGVGR